MKSAVLRITDSRNGRELACHAYIARSIWSRTKGLIGCDDLSIGLALIIPKCKQVHTFFMRFTIDVIFIDSEHRVVGLCSSLMPYRFSGYYKSADCTIELPEGAILASEVKIGDRLIIEGYPS